DDTAEAEAAQVVQGFTDYQRSIEQLSIADTFGLPSLRWFRDPWRDAMSRQSSGSVHEIIDRIIARHHDDPAGSRVSLLSMLLQGARSDTGSEGRCPLGAIAARNEAIVMFMAGHETTANSLAWTLYLLDRFPAAAQKLHQELDWVLGERPPCLEDVENLPYTRAVFE